MKRAAAAAISLMTGLAMLKSVLLQNSSDRNYIEYVERGWSLLGKR